MPWKDIISEIWIFATFTASTVLPIRKDKSPAIHIAPSAVSALFPEPSPDTINIGPVIIKTKDPKKKAAALPYS